MASSKLEVKLFGAVAVSRGSTVLGARDFGGTKAKQLFQLLVLARGEPVPKDRLADLIWGEALPVHVNATLETYVSVLRRKLTGPNGEGRGLITTEHEAYALPLAGYELDLARFDELVRLAEVAEPSARRRYLEDALALATGSVLADEPYSEWAIDERWRYERRVIDTAIAASAAAMADRDARSALTHAERAIAIEPLDERGYLAGLLALRALGRDRDAIALYDRCCASIAEAEAPAVSDALHELRATIERRETINVPQRPRTLPRAARSVTHAAPMRLLGRVDELDLLNQVLTATRDGGSDLVMIEGELGIGKTTLLEAAARDLEGIGLGWARCSELVSGIPYAALALALREVLGTSTVDVRDFPALAGVFPEMRVRSSRAAPRTVDALESLIALVEALRPLVLVLDDLHWADSDTLVALDYLSSRGPLRGVTVAAAFRPEEIDTATASLACGRRCASGSGRSRSTTSRVWRSPTCITAARGTRSSSASPSPRTRAASWRAPSGSRIAAAPRASPPCACSARRACWRSRSRLRGWRGTRAAHCRGRTGTRPALPAAPALTRRRALPLPHQVDARGDGRQPLARLAEPARAAHRARRSAWTRCAADAAARGCPGQWARTPAAPGPHAPARQLRP